MANIVTKIFTANNSILIPGGVTSVQVIARKKGTNIAPVYNNGAQTGGNIAAVPAYLDGQRNLYMWGLNTTGQCGINTNASFSSPIMVVGGFRFVQFSSNASKAYSAALTDQGYMYCWGANANGELGDNSSVAKSSPVLVVGNLVFQQLVVTSGPSTFGLTDAGILYAWGFNTGGQLGDGTITSRSSPVAVGSGTRYFCVTASSQNTFAIDSARGLWAWGNGVQGQMGDGTSVSKSSPVQVVGGLSWLSVYQSDAGDSVFGIRSTKAAYGWGNNDHGQLGIGSVTKQSSPVAVVGGLLFSKIWSVSNNAGSVYALGLTTSGTLYGWGGNENGNLGVGDTTARSSPTLVVGGLTFSTLAVSAGNVVALTSTNDLYAWGTNGNGELGIGNTTAKSSPTLVLGGISWLAIGGLTPSLGVSNLGLIYAWGLNTNGELGLGDTTPRSSPTLIQTGLVTNLDDYIQTSTIAVTPGTSYAINIQKYTATFGNVAVGQGTVDSVTVVYQQ